MCSTRSAISTSPIIVRAIRVLHGSCTTVVVFFRHVGEPGSFLLTGYSIDSEKYNVRSCLAPFPCGIENVYWSTHYNQLVHVSILFCHLTIYSVSIAKKNKMTKKIRKRKTRQKRTTPQLDLTHKKTPAITKKRPCMSPVK